MTFLERGIATGVLSTFRLLGGAIATAIYLSIARNTFQDRLHAEILRVVDNYHLPATEASDLFKAALLNTASAFKAVPGLTSEVSAATKLGIKHSWTHAYQTVYLAAIPFGIVALICACFIRSTAVELKTNRTSVRLENDKIASQETLENCKA